MIVPRNDTPLGECSRGSELMLGTKSAPKPFWSVDHVSFEAVAAYADGKLGEKAAARAREHFEACAECAEQLQAQVHAREALRQSPCVRVPARLIGLLSAIPSGAAAEAAFPAHGVKRRPGSVR